MAALSNFLKALDPVRKSALVAAGVMATLVGAQTAEAGQFFGKRTLPVRDVRVAKAFDDRATEHLADLIDLAHGLIRLDLRPRPDMSGAEQARKIQFSYLYEYAKSPHQELKGYDKFFLEADRRTPEGRQIDAIADQVNAKKDLLIRGTTIVDEIAGALQREDYDRAQRLSYRFNEIMDTDGANLLKREVNPYSGGARQSYDAREYRKPTFKEQATEAVLGLFSK
jgi:hypothetical protein